MDPNNSRFFSARVLAYGAAVAFTGVVAAGIAIGISMRVAAADTASASHTAATPVSDAELKSALQKRLLIPDPDEIQLGPAKPSGIPGLLTRTVTVHNAE